MPEYKLKNGDVYSFTDDEQDKVKDLLADYPDAEEISKKVTPTNTDAVVEVDQASDTDSTLASGSSGLYDRKSMTGSNTYYDKLEKEKDSKKENKPKFTNKQIDKGIQDFSVDGVEIKQPKKSEVWRANQTKLKQVKKKYEKELNKLVGIRENIGDEQFRIQEKVLIEDEKNELKNLRLNQDISATDNELLTFDDALDNLIKDPTLVKENQRNRYVDFLKQIPRLVNYDYDPYEGDDRIIDIDDDIKAEVIDIASKNQLQQLAKNRMPLEQKEELLTKARINIINNKQITFEEELQTLTDEMSLVSGGDMTMDNLDSPNRIKRFKELFDQRKDLATSFQKMQGQYGLDIATGVIKNNFQGTEELKKFNERYTSGTETSLTGDLMSRFNSGMLKAGLDMTLGAGSYLLGGVGSEIVNLVTDGGDYNIFDEFKDVAFDIADFNTAGKGKTQKFEIKGGAEGYARLAADMLPFSLAIIGAAKSGNIKGVKKTIGNVIGGKTGRLNGLTSKLKNEILVADAAFKVTITDNVKEAESLGLESAQAAAYAFAKSFGTAITSAKVGIEGRVLNPQKFSQEALKSFANNLKTASTKAGIKNATNEFLKLQGGELLQEETEVLLDLAVKTSFALALPGYENSVQQQKELIAGTLMLSTGLGASSISSSYNQAKQGLYDNVIKYGSDLQRSFDVLIKQAKDPITINELQKGKQYAVDIIRAAKVAPENVTAEQLDLLVEKQMLLKKKEKTDSAFHGEINKEIEVINTKIAESTVTKSKEQVASKIKEGVDKLGKKLGFKSKRLKDNAAVEEYLNKISPNKDNVKKAGELGFFVAFKDGSKEFVINEEANAKEGVITTDAHEALHYILNESVKNSPETQKALGLALLQELKKIDQGQIADSNFATRLKSYLLDPKISDGDAIEEALTLFSEATLTGDIVYNESVITKIGDFIRQTLQSIGIGQQVVFNEGRDVFNFIKDYNNSIKKGKANNFIVDVAQKPVGKLIKDKTKTDSKTEVDKFKESKSNLDDKLKQYDNDPKKLVRNMLTYPLSRSEYAKETGAINEAITKRLYDPILPDKKKLLTRDEFLDALIGESATMVEQEYDGSQSLDKFVSNRLNLRANSLAKRLGIEQEIKTEISDAKGITIDPEPEPETTRPTKSKLRRDLKIDEKLIKKIKDAVRKTLGTKLPSIESPKFKQALKKAFRTELKVPLANLLGTRTKYRTFLEENFKSIYDAIPQETLNKRFKQFIEATGKREKTAQGNAVFNKRKINEQEFVDYFLGPDVGGSTKGTRKDALAETLGEIMAIDATIEVSQEPDIKTKREEIAKLQGQKVTPTDKAKIALTLNRDPDIKFSKKNIDKIFGPKVLDSNNEKDRDLTFKVLTEIFPKFFPVTDVDGKLLMQSNYNWASAGSKENTRKKYRMMFLADSKRKGTSVYKGKNILEEALKNERKFSEREKYILKIAAQAKTGFFTRKKNPIKFGSKEYFKLLNDNYDGLEYFLYQLQEMVKAYPETKPVIGALFNAASSSSGHIIRQSGIIRGVDKNFIKFEQNKKLDSKKYKTEKEHVWQQNQAGELMAWMVTTGNVKKWMPFIKNNYYMLGLTAVNNDKLKDTKGIFGSVFNYGNQQAPQFIEKLNEALKENNPDLAIESIIRYFNTEVNNNNDGFNSNELTFDGKSISELYNVTVDKSLRDKETQAFQNELIREQVLGEEINAQKEMNAFLGIAPSKEKAATKNNNMLPAEIKFSKSEKYTNNNVLEKMAEVDNTNKQAALKFSKSEDLSKQFNDIIENKTGIGTDKRYAKVKAKVAGAGKGKFNFFVPPSAEDFVGLLYKTLGKGKTGDAQMAWYKVNLLDPFARAMNDLNRDRLTLLNDYKALKKDLKIVPKNLRKKIPGEPFTREQAVRVYIWDQQGMSIPGLSQTDLKELTKYVNDNADLKIFGDQLLGINKGDLYNAPKNEGWTAGDISSDLLEGLRTTKRTKYLELWQQNVDQIFSETNLNKLEAAFGEGYRGALENMLYRMKTGRNRTFGKDGLMNRATDWLTNSVGAIMFFNTRSAILQTISSINFINWSDNNILQAGKAFANIPQYKKDFVKLMNSPFLLARRDGLKMNVNEADIADMAKDPGSMARRFIAKTLRLGFLPTQIADSFAIASGGATFYRNRIKKYMKEGMNLSKLQKNKL
jgi:hypothetical protein